AVHAPRDRLRRSDARGVGDASVVTCRWKDGRIGTMRALRPYSDYGAVLFRKTEKNQVSDVRPIRASTAELDRELVKFFQTGTLPVANEETLELMAFLDAAQRSKEAGGKPMKLR